MIEPDPGLAAILVEDAEIDRTYAAVLQPDDRTRLIDAPEYTIFRECVTCMLEDQSTITRGARYVMVARYLERSADHACTIAEATVFMQTGERVEIK